MEEVGWSLELEEQLIDLWEERPCLYDVSSKGYSNRNWKRKALDEMAEALSQPKHRFCRWTPVGANSHPPIRIVHPRLPYYPSLHTRSFTVHANDYFNI